MALCGNNLKCVISKCMLSMKFVSTSCKVVLKWMPQNPFDEKSKLVQVRVSPVRQQAITWNYFDPDLCCQMASLGHNKSTHWGLNKTDINLQMTFSNSQKYLVYNNSNFTEACSSGSNRQSALGHNELSDGLIHNTGLIIIIVHAYVLASNGTRPSAGIIVITGLLMAWYWPDT